MCTLNVCECDMSEMSDIQGNIFTSSTDTTDKHNTVLLCKKCNCQEAEISLRNKNKYCKMCFLTILTHKFRATLGKSKLMQPTDSVLVAYSGKANSTVLLHLLKGNANESISKMLHFPFKVLYIDDGIVKGLTFIERESIRNALVKEAKNLEIMMYILPLSKCITDATCNKMMQPVNIPLVNVTNEDAMLQESFNNLENDTARDELLQQLKRKLLVSAARELNCNKIFIADTSVDLAIKVLGNISTGRGYQLPFNVAFSDMRHTDVTLLRPLKDFTGDDITGYINCYKLYPILSPQKYNFSFPSSIRNIARKFVHKLDSEFFGTVSTIYRTSEKLATNMRGFNKINNDTKITIDRDVSNTCILCEISLDSCYLPEEQLSVVKAKLFSKLVSTVGETSLDMTMNSLNVCELSNDSRIENINDFSRKRCQCQNDTCDFFTKQSVIEKYLCYSCKLIFFGSKQDNILPNFIFKSILKKSQLACLQEEIEDFLL